MIDPRHVFGQFRAIARQHADRRAITFRRGESWQHWSYADLLARATSIAQRLGALGAKRGDAVGLIAPRCPETISAMLGILAVGAHYVPVDPIQPQARVEQLFAAAAASFVVATVADGSANEVSIVPRDGVEPATPELAALDLAGVDCSAEDLAYVMFTSGSTGRPKGVMVPHRAITRLVAQQDYLHFDSSRVFLHAASMSFDAATLEIWGPLLNGGRCVLYPYGAMPTADGLRKVIAETGVTTAWLTASLFHAIVSHDVHSLSGLGELIVGGESLSVPHVHRALTELPGTQLINGYGPTENTTFSACYRIPRDLSRTAVRVPIGRAIRGTQLAVVNDALRLVEPGTEGELVAMGDGLALGYLGEPDLTDQQFVNLLCADGLVRRGYRSGDRVVELADGSLDFLGRRDDQVKIHGSRIEPSEVEAVISGLAEVGQCRVIVRTGALGQVRLVAYVVLNDGGAIEAIKQAMFAVLPAYMVPHQFIALPALPLNANGKLATELLPEPWPTSSATAAPSNRAGNLSLVEQAWTEVLGFAPESSDVNFFDAGGRSLEAIVLHDLLERKLSLTLDSTFAFEYPTVRRQAAELTVVLAKQGSPTNDGRLPPGSPQGSGSGCDR